MLARGRLAIRLTLSKIPSRLVKVFGILDWALALGCGDPLRSIPAAALRAIRLLRLVTIRLEPVQNSTGSDCGMRQPNPPCLTAPAWNKTQTPTRCGFRLMSVSHSVKVLAFNQTFDTGRRIVQAVRG